MSNEMLFEKVLRFRRNGWDIEREHEDGKIYVHAISGKIDLFLGSYKEEEEKKND